MPGQRASARVIIVSQVTVGVAITVGTAARLRTRLSVVNVTAGWIGSLPRLSIRVRNSGQTFARARGTISCRSRGRWRRFPVVMDTVLPGNSAELAVNAPGLHAGPTRCAVSLHAAGGAAGTWAGAVTIAGNGTVPGKRVASGVYATPAPGMVPAWAIALAVIGLLLVVTASALLVLVWRRRGPRP